MSAAVPKYKYGDEVTIIKYGHLIWQSKEERQRMFSIGLVKTLIPSNLIGENEHLYFIDAFPERVGMLGYITEITITQGLPYYSVSFQGQRNILV